MAYTYQDLLRETKQKKIKAQAEIKAALKGKAGFLCKAELERKPGSIAWFWLAEEFCKTLADHISEWTDADPFSFESREMADIYMAYEDDDPDIYDLLPTEARLFDDF